MGVEKWVVETTLDYNVGTCRNIMEGAEEAAKNTVRDRVLRAQKAEEAAKIDEVVAMAAKVKALEEALEAMAASLARLEGKYAQGAPLVL